MKKIWIVVANSSQSKIYRAINAQHLEEHALFFSDESHLKANELVSDVQGRVTSRFGYGTDTMEPKTPIKVKEATLFANQIAHFLHEGYQSGHCERIYIIAKSPFLGYLRQSLNSHVTKMVSGEINKDLTHLKADEIREYLPPVL